MPQHSGHFSEYVNGPQVSVDYTHSNVAYAQHMVQPQQVGTSYDSNYMVGYPNKTAYAPSGNRIYNQRNSNAEEMYYEVGGEYQNRKFSGPERNRAGALYIAEPNNNFETQREPWTKQRVNYKSSIEVQSNAAGFGNLSPKREKTPIGNKFDTQSSFKARSEKFKVLYDMGPLALSGPIAKVLQWHKSLQNLPILVLYEVVAKCVSVSDGEKGAKNLVIRNESGPAMQVVYYEIDFLLPQLHPPCNIRVVGRVVGGGRRLQAYSVRLAAAGDVAAGPRRAALAARQVEKLCQQYNTQ